MNDLTTTASNRAFGEACLLGVFLANNKIVLRPGPDGSWELFDSGAAAELGAPEMEVAREGGVALGFASLNSVALPEALASAGCRAFALIELYRAEESGLALGPSLARALPLIEANAIRVPYLYFQEGDYIYRFRGEKQRNRKVYHIDATSVALYHSALCDAIKALKRAKERTATTPAVLDFGAVQYLLPSHFGFCLGVQNAIERAYETIAENPGKRVFMLSELIHNPFVNQDLKARGLRYLQSDKGVAIQDPDTGKLYWDTLSSEDIVIIPAFGARDEDKVKLIERGLPLNQYDATCMLVEKVWKAAKRYGQKGYSVIIHGKAEHEETKATFSNSAKYAPSLVIRDMKEASQLAEVISAESVDEKWRLFEPFAGRSTSGFDPVKDLERIAVVNQTTLLRDETLKIIEFLETAIAARHGADAVAEHVAAGSKGDTLCYATQVNQDALAKALADNADAAIVVGGKNSSNTFQLFRLCQAAFGERAFYIQSEADIESRSWINHFLFPYNPNDPKQGRHERREFLPEGEPLRILITGGASCPDGILQQIIARINGFFDPSRVRAVDGVLADLVE